MTHIGYADEVDKFLARNPGIERLYDQAMDVASFLYSEEKMHTIPAAAIPVFGLVAAAYEIFLEIFCLAANGFGRAAQARLRTLYENVAVAAFLTKYPESCPCKLASICSFKTEGGKFRQKRLVCKWLRGPKAATSQLFEL